MRITVEEKNATRQRIITAAQSLFVTRGFEATTTRDIARESGIATGTLFNYFPTKEDIVGQLAAELLVKAWAAFERQALVATLEEELFALIAAELRQLKPLRKFLAPLLETTFGPLAIARQGGAEDALRVEHLEIVVGIARKQGFAEISPVLLQVYWTLYTGVLAFWAADKSPKQEDTLALLDQSLNMFTAWLRSTTGESQ